LGYEVLFLFVLKCWKIQRKESLLGIGFDLDFNIFLEIFLSVFLCSKHFIFSLLSYHLYPIYKICFGEKIGLWSIVITKVVCGIEIT